MVSKRRSVSSHPWARARIKVNAQQLTKAPELVSIAGTGDRQLPNSPSEGTRRSSTERKKNLLPSCEPRPPSKRCMGTRVPHALMGCLAPREGHGVTESQARGMGAHCLGALPCALPYFEVHRSVHAVWDMPVAPPSTAASLAHSGSPGFAAVTVAGFAVAPDQCGACTEGGRAEVGGQQGAAV